jgi:cytochrome c oxidase assembly protein subunit 15
MKSPPAVSEVVPPRAVAHWLLALYALVGLMVAVGGITRLTGSGLSITEWKPVVGALPPLNESDWQRAFELYQASPQFRQVNHWMSLSDFKGIYFWEWFHRLLGRFIGVAFFVPWLVFLVRGRLQGAWARRTAVAFVLGGLQGALGWFMVASGLVDVPQVSHYRLAAHLSLAFFVGMYLLWLWLDLRRAAEPAAPEPAPVAPPPAVFFAFLALLAVQIVYGAFMAGSRAGYLFQTFPDMNGLWLVTGSSYLDDPVGIHFVHRALGWVVGIAGLALAWRLRPWASGRWLGALVLVQFGLGVATVMTSVQITLAVTHQLGAWALLSASVIAWHRARRG